MVTRRLGKIGKATKAELEALGNLDSELGAIALKLAGRLDAAGEDEPGSAMASLAKELRATMVAARQLGKPAADPVNELAERRRRRLSGA